jgi:hypothetical protein
MGLSFHYRGQLAKPEYLPELIDIVKQVCDVYKWEYFLFNPVFPEGTDFSNQEFTDEVYGITFTPPGCESVDISFLSNGRMSSPYLLQFHGSDQESIAQGLLYILSVKTQFSSPAIHLVLMKLFRHLSDKYLTNFHMTDESGYWETNDESILNKNFARYKALLDNFSLGLASIQPQTDEKLIDHLIRIANRINNLE